MKRHGGARQGAGRPVTLEDRVERSFLVLATDREEIRTAAKRAGVPITQWLREAAERALEIEPARVRLPRGRICARVYATLPGALVPRLEERARAQGVKRLATFLRLAALDRLAAESTPDAPVQGCAPDPMAAFRQPPSSFARERRARTADPKPTPQLVKGWVPSERNED